jgi:glycosyltransferase involved in cell wall biosynthesis
MISVVIPAYNSGACIRDAIESSLSQKVNDSLEIVIVDDASSDDTPRILAEFSGDDRVKVLVQETNQGPAASRNLAIASARGEYIALLDADDLMCPGRLAAQLSVMQEAAASVALVSTWTKEQLPSGRTKRINRFRAGHERQRLKERIFLGQISAITPTLFFRRSDALAVDGFDELLFYREDSDFILKLLERGEMKVIEAPLVLRRISSSGMSSQIDADAFLFSRRRLAERAISRTPFLSRCLKRYWAEGYWILARKLADRDPIRSRELLKRSLRERPSFKAAAALVLASLRGSNARAVRS